MEKAKLKAIIHDLENVLESLKSEVYADAKSYLDTTKYEEIKKGIEDYDQRRGWRGPITNKIKDKKLKSNSTRLG